MKRARRPLGHVTERPKGSGRWAIVISIRDPQTGKRRRKWHTYPEERGKTATQKQAQAELSRLLAQVSANIYVEPNKTTLAQYLDQWLATIKPTVSPKTYERYEQVCRKNIAPLLGAVRLA